MSWLPKGIVLALFGLLALVGMRQAPTAAPQVPVLPNIVMVRWDDGNATDNAALKPDGTPVMKYTLQYLAQGGTTFTNFAISNAVCTPSRASVLQGQYAHHTGVWDNNGIANFNDTHSIALWAHQVGYFTAHVGKYLNGYQVTDGIPPGWDYWFTSVGQQYYDYDVSNNGWVEHHGTSASEYHTDLMFAKALRVIRDNAATGQPLFLIVDLNGPHESDASGLPPPLQTQPIPANRHIGALAGMPTQLAPSYNVVHSPGKPAWIQALPHLSGSQQLKIASYQQARRECLLSVDEGVYRVVTTLSSLGRLDNSLVVGCSDNGWHYGEFCEVTPQHSKEDAYEVPTTVPLMIRAPGIPGGQVVNEVTVNVDLTATMLDYMQASADLPQDGLSLRPLLDHPSGSLPRLGVLLESDKHIYTGLRANGFSYIETDADQDGVAECVELYDLSADPDEMTSVANDPSYSTLMQQFHDEMIFLATH